MDQSGAGREIRPDQATRQRTASAPHTRVPGDLRGQFVRSGQRRIRRRPDYNCIFDGMPRAMNLVLPMEFVIKRNIVYVHLEYQSALRRIYTDGRDFPTDQIASWMGYSIGKWIDEDGDGRYDVLEVETRNLKNPRTYDASGVPMHKDGQTVVKERFYLDKANPDILYDQVTTY